MYAHAQRNATDSIFWQLGNIIYTASVQVHCHRNMHAHRGHACTILRLGHAYFKAFYALLTMSRICALKNLRVQCGPPPSSVFPVFLISLAQWSTPWWWRGVVVHNCCCHAFELALRCVTPAFMSFDSPWLSSHPVQALISYRTASRTASSTVHFTNPLAGLMCRKCFLKQEAPATTMSSQYLSCMRLAFQLNDVGINSLLHPFLGTLNVYVHVRTHWGDNR